MLCLSLFPTFTPSNFVRVIDSSVPCALAFWLCFITPHLYQLAWFQLGGLSNLKKKKKQAQNQLLWVLCVTVSLCSVPSARAPAQAMHWCLSHHALCSSSTPSPGDSGGPRARLAHPGTRMGTGSGFPPPAPSALAGPALALISGTSRAPLSLRQHQGSSRECRVGGAAMYK